MYISITEDQRRVIEEYRNAATNAYYTIKRNGTELSLSFFIQVRILVYQFLLSYKEYSLSNVREYGLGEILLMRALRFFRLDIRDPEKEKRLIRKIKKTKRGIKRVFSNTLKAVLFPCYLILLLLDWIRKNKRRHKNKSNKHVKNSFRV